MTSVAIVLGSVRPGRWGEQVANWVQGSAQEAGFEATIIDLRDFDLPVFAEEMAPSIEAPTQPEGVRFRQALEARDAVIFVTPEYNHSIPGGLKNAIDLPASVNVEGQVGRPGGLLVVWSDQAPSALARNPGYFWHRDSRPTGRVEPWLRLRRRCS